MRPMMERRSNHRMSGRLDRAVGQTVNLTAMVTSTAGIPTGTVVFLDGTTALGTATLDGTGPAGLAVTFDTAGDHTLTAVYSGDRNFQPGISDPLDLPVI